MGGLRNVHFLRSAIRIPERGTEPMAVEQLVIGRKEIQCYKISRRARRLVVRRPASRESPDTIVGTVQELGLTRKHDGRRREDRGRRSCSHGLMKLFVGPHIRLNLIQHAPAAGAHLRKSVDYGAPATSSLGNDRRTVAILSAASRFSPTDKEAG